MCHLTLLAMSQFEVANQMRMIEANSGVQRWVITTASSSCQRSWRLSNHQSQLWKVSQVPQDNHRWCLLGWECH